MITKRNIKRLIFVLLILAAVTICFFIVSEKNSDLATLRFYLILDKNVYLDSIYGEPPQIAIWLENPENGHIKNVWTSYRTGKNDWVGKAYCDVSLPYWQSINGRTKKDKFYKITDDDQVDAFTMATPKSDFIKAKTHVAKGSKWNYYIEINVSGDFNESFPAVHPKGYPDLEGNGQPSIIYKGSIAAIRGQKDVPVIIGRTDQWQPVDKIIEDVNGITTAAKLMRKVRVTCGWFL